MAEATHFPIRTLGRVCSEMSLHIQARPLLLAQPRLRYSTR